MTKLGLKLHHSASSTRIVKPLDPVVAAAHPDNTVINSRYTVWNFVFLNLYEQFRRPINFYFLIVASLQFISVIAPVHPLSTVLPLLLAFSLTALKEGYDDVKRHQLDATYNNRQRRVLDVITGEWQTRKNYAIRVGDVIFLKHDEEVPCDVVVVAASAPTVYIRTDNLDGELDLKPRDVITAHNENETLEKQWAVHVNDAEAVIVEKLQGLRVECPPPSALIDSFDGRVTYEYPGLGGSPSCFALTQQHLLPQTSVLKNTESVICVAVYTGKETKCGMNKRPAQVKWAKIDKDISIYSIVIFCCQMILAFSFGIGAYFKNQRVEEKFWYLPEPATETSASFIIYPMRFFLLTTVMIPVSFKFVVDMSKYYMTKTVEWDETMMHDGPNGEGCRVKNSSILEDLGQIDYVLSDKTGTMTKNVMELQYVTVLDHQIRLSTVTSVLPAESGNGDHIRHFGRVVALCNVVDVVYSSESGGVPQYQSSSPDEEALCYGMAKLGVQLIDRKDKEVTLNVDGTKEVWKVHYTFPFSSELKSMGVIVENMSNDKIYFFVKGADDRVMEMVDRESNKSGCLNGGMNMSDETAHMHLNSYAMQGLRTLLVAEKSLQKDALQAFLSRVRLAEVLMQNRVEKLRELRLEIENAVRIIGITAVEDKLQENVEETIRDFQQAGVKVWMLTGDKVQTAEQIGLSCGLYVPGDEVLRIVAEDDWEGRMMSLCPRTASGDDGNHDNTNGVLSPHGNNTMAASGAVIISRELTRGLNLLNEEELHTPMPKSGYCLLEDSSMCGPLSVPTGRRVLLVQGGVILEHILSTPAYKERFSELCDDCVSVICARVTPSQKAAVTHFVRSRGFMTLAVGDGGNDIAMLQEAHVGVGISGKEGKQAARAADFSITRFSDLRVLTFVHGQQAYMRTAYVIKYSFYKSMLISVIQLAYNVVGTYVSGGSFWNSFSLTVWNGLYTLPQTLFYCLDRAAPRHVLERHPFLYKMTRHASDMNVKEFFVAYLLRGAIQSIATLWLVNAIYGNSFAYADTGGEASKDVIFSVAYSALIISQMLTLLLESHSITYLNALFIFGMPVVYFLLTTGYSAVSNLQYYGVWNKTLTFTSVVAAFGVAFVLVIPPFALHVLHRTLYPDPREVLRGAAVRNIMRRRDEYWRRITAINRWLLCVPEESSRERQTSYV